ncbi:hypothetical protein VTJ83DRAFT_5332 [Remersonia thermophila]|uniref:Peroxin/Ferlin domain-containing protein n=1 Tax=Remersonia thermophila TaxID=72144 RepID=A0ABR4D7C2_9PEZI
MAAFEPWIEHMSSTPRSHSHSHSAQRGGGDLFDSSSSSSYLHPPTSAFRNDGPSSFLSPGTGGGGPAPTYAAFSPATLSAGSPGTSSFIAASAAKRRSTILVHQKSPLLLATPPQITRALAYSHPFLLPLNRFVGLLTWTTADPWESFLLLVGFWAAVLYGDVVVRVAGPVVLVLVLIAGMYGRRFSPLSSSGWSEPGDGAAAQGDGKAARRTKNLSVDGLPDNKAGPAGAGGGSGGGGTGGGAGKGHQRAASEVTSTRHHKTLDEIVETLREFTARCNILLEPLLELTDFLSTQRTPTSATTRPALTTLFVRILLCTPFWYLLTLPPWRIVTTQRVVLILGTILLSWHSRVARVTRVILWRSLTVRRMLALVTGLRLDGLDQHGSPATAAASAAAGSSASKKPLAALATAITSPRHSELTKALRRAGEGRGTGVRFTFIIYENQRRWVGLGWTTSLFSYERPAWTDEHNNAVPPRTEFELPEVEDGSNMRWRWAEGSRWRVDGVPDEAVRPGGDDRGDGDDDGDDEEEWDYDGPGGKMGWIYYDNKWQNGRRGQDGWGRWTRRRKWYRDAELVEADEDDEDHHEPPPSQPQQNGTPPAPLGNPGAGPATPRPPPGLNPTPAIPTVDLTPSSPVGLSHTPSLSTSSSPQASSASPPTPSLLGRWIGGGNNNKERDNKDKEDAASVLSSSLSSTHTTSNRSVSASVTSVTPGAATATLRRRLTAESSSMRSQRSRAASSVSASVAVEDDDIAALGTETRIAVQEASAGGEGAGWGVGDEVRMGLE